MNYYFFNDAIQSKAVYLARGISTPKEAVLLSDHQIEMFVKGVMPQGKQRKAGTLELEDIPELTDSELAKIEYVWVKSEIESITEQLEKHADNSSRAIATEQEWRNYREELRKYATVDDDGVYSLRTEKPVRPS